jgi:hypothetical protein
MPATILLDIPPQEQEQMLAALLKAPPRAYGWCRTRWSCATLAAQLTAKHGLAVSAWTVRRWLHELGWCGNAPHSSPKMTIPSGSSAWQSPVMIRHASKVSTTRNRTLPLCICS